jgi:hypothetical protein
MSDDDSTKRLVTLLERQIAIQLYFAAANQDTIARVLQKSKGWVNDLLRGFPRRTN